MRGNARRQREYAKRTAQKALQRLRIGIDEPPRISALVGVIRFDRAIHAGVDSAELCHDDVNIIELRSPLQGINQSSIAIICNQTARGDSEYAKATDADRSRRSTMAIAVLKAGGLHGLQKSEGPTNPQDAESAAKENERARQDRALFAGVLAG